jgi:rubrerythrin
MHIATQTGMNRTGIGMSPLDGAELVQGAQTADPSSPGDGEAMDALRSLYEVDKQVIGSVPPPSTLTGALGTVAKAIKGADMATFIDRLGERLAFERTGSRLYEALMNKHRNRADPSVEPSLEQLAAIHDDEVRHFEMLREAILSLGGDPTVETPAADVSAVASTGLVTVLTDPRTTFTQSLEAILVAELVDVDCWSMLAAQAERFGHDELARHFRAAFEQEERHLAQVRRWFGSRVLDGGPTD